MNDLRAALGLESRPAKTCEALIHARKVATVCLAVILILGALRFCHRISIRPVDSGPQYAASLGSR